MQEEELKQGTSVFTADGDELGEISRFVLDPRTNEITHLVIQKGGLFSEDKVVPFSRVHYQADEGFILSQEIDDYDQLPPFEETHFVAVDDLNPDPEHPTERPPAPSGAAYYWYPPYGYLGDPAYRYYGLPLAVTQQNIPEGTVSLREGSDVVSSDGKHVGDVERLLIEGDSNHVTHFIISQGLFFKDRKLVPAHWIRTVTEDKVELNVSSRLLEGLPDYKPE